VDAIHLPPGLTLPSAFGAPAAPLQAGQVVQALVLELIEAGVFRLQLPQGVIDVRSSVPLTPGSTITLAVKGTGQSTRLAIYTDVPPMPSAARGATPAPSLMGRTPIGEAVVIARGAAQRATAAPQSAGLEGRTIAPATARPTPEPAVLREATPDTPAPVARQSEAPVRLTPEQAVTEAIRTAAPRQAGLAPLFADLEQVVQTSHAAQPPGPSPLPAPVRQAAADVLLFRVPLGERLMAGDVKQAFTRSGVLLEPRLVAGGPAVPLAADDLKAALLVLRRVLDAWSASEATAERTVQSLPSSGDADVRHVANVLAGLPDDMPQRAPISAEEAASLAKSLSAALTKRDAPSASMASAASALPPPYRGAPPTAQAVAAPSFATDATPHDIAGRLIAATDGALARQTLLQVASLPEQPDQPRMEPAQHWSFEVPFATPQGTAIAQFEVRRDTRAAKADPQPRTWRARFSLDIEPMGPVHALIALSGARTSVTLWAERAATAARLNDSAATLSEALRAAALEPGDFQARLGAPPVARQSVPGAFMDRAS
jgi:hypothetical protein